MKKFYPVLLLLLCFTVNAQTVNIPDANFKQFLLNHVPVIDVNNDDEIQVSEALAVTELFATSANIADATGIQAFTNLTLLNLSDNSLSTININGLVNLSLLNVDSNALTSIDFGNVTAIWTLGLGNNQLTTLDLSGMSIGMVGCPNNALTSIDLTGADIQELRCQDNMLTQLNLSDLENLTEINCNNNQLIALGFLNNPILTTVDCTDNPIMTLDFSQNPSLFEISVFNPVLEYINLKNGGTSEIYLDWLDEAPNLRFVCADIQDVAYFTGNFAAFGFPLVHVSSYCTFSPGGKHNTITGTFRSDIDNDGCTATDPVLANVRLNITDGSTEQGAVFSNQSGSYELYTDVGNFTLNPVSPSPYYTFSPFSPTITFATNNQNVTTQDFCLASSGIHQDLAITMLSTIPARPGFNAVYVLYYENKGTEVMSGTVNLQFNDNLMDFENATPGSIGQGTGSLDWSFADLVPLETRAITVTMHINPPTATPPVNIGDPLNFTATVFPLTGDETPVDNVFTLEQIVVGSFDPNDITCQEGDVIGVEQVGDYLHYLIRFQNSGNFYAENVVVKNTIADPGFDLASLAVIGTSHDVVTRMTGTIVEFIFEGINLPAEADNEPASHGYVAYKIKTKNNLAIGDAVAQFADIYFDYNFPITTNTATTTVSALGLGSNAASVMRIFPNPAADTVNVSADAALTRVSFYDLQGRLLSSQPVNSESITIDLRHQAAGIYLLKVESLLGSTTERLVKQ